ncbi:efflux transporter outer membrane subunit [Motilimonas sp. 1_MG-2023]|uniref:efflux transporter outer membrane subunit n=1 Tax=Motilimonas sp. 1_MG-2023 TaxID=3062672 RepID=UPI0026E3D1DB|nr:efflux transporter outer membrane subunit [Motilimonas sp. 1_MG-2023]MDO6527554.1 efflux transporter outer membrane subunit [Motilimonas sp. 1_MG-2023]
MTRNTAYLYTFMLSIGLFGCSLSAPQQAELSPSIAANWSAEHQNAPVAAQFMPQLTALPDLHKLVLQGLTKNPTLLQSQAKVDASMALLKQQQAQRWPQINAYLSGRRQDNGQSITDNTQFGIDLSWELDIWGKLDDASRAALLDASANLNLLKQQQLELTATIAQQWFNLLAAQHQYELIHQRRLNLVNNLLIIEEGYQAGLNGSLDVFLARADVAGAQSSEAAKADEIKQASRALQLSLGEYPTGNLRANGTFSLNLDKLPAGLPSQLLQRRPDIQGAQDALSAANARISVAYKEKFPSIKLTSGLGNSSPELNELLRADSMLWNLFANLSTPLFNAGLLEARQQQQEALALAAAANLQASVLNAFQQVEAALSKEATLVEQLDKVSVAAQNSLLAEELAFEQYQGGLVDYVTVLEAQRRSFDSQSARINIRNQRLQNRIELLLALGGDPHTLPRPTVATNQESAN